MIIHADLCIYHLSPLTSQVTPTHHSPSLFLITAFIVFFGLISAFFKEKYGAGEAIITVVITIILGAYVIGFFSPCAWGGGLNFVDITLELPCIVIALSVFAIGFKLLRAPVLQPAF